MSARLPWVVAATVLALLAAGCSGVQSALEPAGAEAGRIDTLFRAVTIFCTLVLVAVLVAVGVALSGRRAWRERLASDRLIIGAGIVFPVAALSVLLGWSLWVMSAGGSAAAGRGLLFSSRMEDALEAGSGLRIAVTGERWWWRVVYVAADGRRFESANELRLPVGEPVPVLLGSADVIHSFWVPKLAGKLDMIPGRINTLTLNATAPGVSRGQCAEYCGGPHALMAFYVVAMPPAEFTAWLEREAGPAAAPAPGEAAAGHALFVQHGCGGCHAIRGTAAKGTIGPDLTHVGSRLSLGAGILPNDAGAFARWIRDNQQLKPENLMPPFGVFTDDELSALATYLEELE
jgi:cytochrome c oxidase subunit 2